MALKKNTFPFGNKPGFSLIETVITIAIVVVLLGIAIPNMLGRRATQERKTFVSQWNSIMNEVWLRALEKGTVHKINLDLEHRTMTVSEKTEKLGPDKKIIFDPVQLFFVDNSFVWPETFDIQQLYIEKVDRIGEGGMSRKTENIWFFVMPDGTTQEVIMNILDSPEDQPEKDAKQFSVVINPFTCQCVMYDTFQKPLS